MGTNYSMRFPSPSPICECCGHPTQREDELHLGKASGGWSFTFHGNDDLYGGVLIRSQVEWEAEVQRRLDLGQVIYDEYGTLEPFPDLQAWIRQVAGNRNHTRYCREHHPYDLRCWLDDQGNAFRGGEFS